ncbi:MAG: hypothetical protein ACKOCO_06055, partial [Bacteroidota bacterium]
LALAYPYTHNLWYFLAIRSRQTNHPDTEKNITTAAVYSLDRSQLFRLVAPQMITPQAVWVQEEVLELKPVETLKKRMENTASVQHTQPERLEMTLEQTPVKPEVQEADIMNQLDNQPPSDEPEKIVQGTKPSVPTYQTYEAWYNSFNVPLLSARKKVDEEIVVEEKKAVHFEEDDTEEIENEEITNIQNSKNIPQGTGVAQMLAERSVSENKDVISETLARLFARQGYREKAILMYERLILTFPEKSAYFAAEIDKLKK